MAEPFPEILRALAAMPDNLVLDGELVVPDAYGRSDFEEVRRRNLLQPPRMIADAAARRPAVLVVFDLLESRGDDLRSLRYSNAPGAPCSRRPWTGNTDHRTRRDARRGAV